MRPLDAGPAVERVEAVVAAQQHEPLVLQPGPAQQHPDHRRLQVVQPDPARDPAQRVERGDEPVEEALLGLVGIRHVHRLARVRQPQHEHPQPHQHPTDPGLELAEVDLGLLGRQVRLRHHHQPHPAAQLPADLGDESAHRGLGHLRALLVDQPLPNPPSGMALLDRRRPVGDQPAAHHRPMRRSQRRRRPLRRLALRRHRTRQRLPHHPPMHPVPARQPPHRQPLQPAVPPDPLEQLHLRSPLHPVPASTTPLRDITERRNGRTEVGPNQAITPAPSGARSRCHSQPGLGCRSVGCRAARSGGRGGRPGRGCAPVRGTPPARRPGAARGGRGR